MTRPRKQTVDYFPHVCKHGKTMFILEQRYGNDGYAFWFKLLELLGCSEGHFIDMNDLSNWHYICTLTRVSDRVAKEILDLLSELSAIDKDLWEHEKTIWSDNFVNNLNDVYRKRTAEIPMKPDNSRQKPPSSGITPARNPQSKVKESKVKESIYIPPVSKKKNKKQKTPIPDNFAISSRVKEWAVQSGHGFLDEHLDAFKRKVAMKGYEYIDWDAALMEAIREDWAKLRGKTGGIPISPPEPTCPKCGAAWRTKTKDKIIFNCECPKGEK